MTKPVIEKQVDRTNKKYETEIKKKKESDEWKKRDNRIRG